MRFEIIEIIWNCWKKYLNQQFFVWQLHDQKRLRNTVFLNNSAFKTPEISLSKRNFSLVFSCKFYFLLFFFVYQFILLCNSILFLWIVADWGVLNFSDSVVVVTCPQPMSLFRFYTIKEFKRNFSQFFHR